MELLGHFPAGLRIVMRSNKNVRGVGYPLCCRSLTMPGLSTASRRLASISTKLAPQYISYSMTAPNECFGGAASLGRSPAPGKIRGSMLTRR